MYWLLKTVLFIFSKFPIRMVQAIGGFFGTIAWYALADRRRVAIINAGIIGVPNPKRTAKLSFKHTFKSYFETAYLMNVDDAFLKKYVICEGKEHYDELVRKDQKFVFINAHIGSWDLSAQVVPKLYGFKTLIVGRENNSEAINRILDDMRNAGNVIYMRQQGFIEKVAQLEKQGYVSGSLLDHSTTQSDSVIAPFFGLRVPTLAGMAALCARKKIPMLPCYLIRTPKGFHVITKPPLYPNQDLKPKERILDLVVRMNEEYEAIIKAYPEQWYLLHKRFKKVEEPDGTISNRIYRP